MDESDLTNLEDVPAIAMTQWRVGRVLSEADVAMIAKLLAEHDVTEAEAVDAFHNGRQSAFFEIGGKELIEAMERGDIATAKASLKKAYATVAEKEAKLRSMNN